MAQARLKVFGWGREGEGITAQEEAFALGVHRRRFGVTDFDSIAMPTLADVHLRVPRITPPALQHHFTHNQVLHHQVLLLAIVTEDVPVMPMKDVIEVTNLGEGFYEVVAHFGFMQTPKVEKILRLCRVQAGITYDENRTTYYLGRDILLINGPERMARWRKILFAFLVRNSLSATAYYGIPPNRVVELGMQVSL